MGIGRTIFLTVIVAVAVLVSAQYAFAVDAPPAAGGAVGGGGAQPGMMPPVNEPVEGGGAAPVAGSQPAAPTALPPVVNTNNTGSVGSSPAVAGNSSKPSSPAVIIPDKDKAISPSDVSDTSSSTSSSTTMIESVSEPVVGLPETVKGGGGMIESSTPESTAVPNAPVVTGGGNLPFTGINQTILLIVLAGMFVPIGVLLYSFARYGEIRLLRRHLAEPRFQWASSPGVAPTSHQ